MEFDIPEIPVKLKTTYTDPTVAKVEEIVVAKPLKRSYTYPYPSSNQKLKSYYRKMNMLNQTSGICNKTVRYNVKYENLERFSRIENKGFICAKDLSCMDHAEQEEPNMKRTCSPTLYGMVDDFNYKKNLDLTLDEILEKKRKIDDFNYKNDLESTLDEILEKKRKRLDVQDFQVQSEPINTNKKFPNPQQIIEAVHRKFKDDTKSNETEDLVFIITGSYYAAHMWRQHCMKTDNSKDLDLLSFSDIDIFYSQPYHPSRSEILDRDSQKDSVAPGFIECYYRNLEINGRIYEINYIRRVDLSITGGYKQLRDFIQNHIDLNLVQAGAMVRLCRGGFELTEEYCSEAFEKFLDDPEHRVAIPDIVNTDTPGNSLIRVLTKATRFGLPYQLPTRSELAKVDFSKRPLVQKFMEGLWDLPPALQKEILDNFHLSDSWNGELKLTTFSLKNKKNE